MESNQANLTRNFGSEGAAPAKAPLPSPLGRGSLAEKLDRRTVVGTLWRAEGDKVRCFACGHRCLIAEGRRGICRVRFNRGGELRVPFGYVSGVQSDPDEKRTRPNPVRHII